MAGGNESEHLISRRQKRSASTSHDDRELEIFELICRVVPPGELILVELK